MKPFSLGFLIFKKRGLDEMVFKISSNPMISMEQGTNTNVTWYKVLHEYNSWAKYGVQVVNNAGDKPGEGLMEVLGTFHGGEI